MNLLALVERPHLVEEEQAEQLGIQPLAGRAVNDRRLGQGDQPEGGMDSQDTVIAHLLVGFVILFLYFVITVGSYEPLAVVQLELPIVNQSTNTPSRYRRLRPARQISRTRLPVQYS